MEKMKLSTYVFIIEFNLLIASNGSKQVLRLRNKIFEREINNFFEFDYKKKKNK